MSTFWLWMVLLALPPLAVLAMVGFNVLVWPRGRPEGKMEERVSLLIPARDEARSIERCVRAALAGSPPPDEVLVYDDGSADATAEIVARVAAEDGRVRLLRGGPLPPGWVGKPHACHHLARAASGDVLVFVDADVVLDPSGLARLGSLFEDFGADAVSVGLRQRVGSWGERLIIPLLHLTYLAWLPLPLVWRSRDPRFLIANGQLLAVRRAAYEAAGGWAVVRGEVVDDMAFCRRIKEVGGRVVFGDGFQMASVRMYEGGAAAWSGFSKNLYEGIGGRFTSLVGVVALYGWVFVVPYAALLAALLGAPIPLLAVLVGLGANMAVRALLALRFRQPAEGILLHPLGVLALLGIALNSWRWSRRGAIRWRGRSYAGRAERTGAGAHAPLDDPAAPAPPAPLPR